MFSSRDYPSVILTAFFVTILVGKSRSFPASELPVGSVLPAEVDPLGEFRVDSDALSVTTADDSAVLRAAAKEPTRVRFSEEPVPQPLKIDFYDYLQLPNDPDDEMAVLPDHAVNVNEDYAGIYDYRGSQDGRFRRKRTLTTNVEQLLTRSSRMRSRRNVRSKVFDDNAAVSPAEQAENLVSLLTVMQDSDPEFDASEFLRVLDAPSVSEQDLEYLLLLSNLASRKDPAAHKELRALSIGHRQRPGDRSRAHPQRTENKPFFLSPNILPDDTGKDGIWADSTDQAGPHQKNDFSRVLAIASLLSARGPSAGIAM